LWVLVSTVLLVPVAIVVAMIFPNPDNIGHKAVFEENLSAESLARLSPADENGIVWDDQVGIEAEMPNGHILRFKKSVSEEEAETVSNEYYDFLKHAANKERAIHILFGIACWLGNAIILYVFGWSIGWVYKGFKKSP